LKRPGELVFSIPVRPSASTSQQPADTQNKH
jgi:hypothetical protein